MRLVAGPQRTLGFHLAEFLDDLGVFKRIAAVDGCLVLVGARFPLAAGIAVPLFQVVQQFLGLLFGQQVADGVRNIFLEQGQREVIAFKIQLRIAGRVATVEASLANGLDFADSVLGVMDLIALLNINGSDSLIR